ncbi:MAG: winged helix DNA-binding domain-containing protein [Myxococcota bacterium]
MTLAARRLANLAVTRPAATPGAVVARLLAIQAQDPGAAAWAVGARCGATAAEVEAGLDDGTVTRTWPMRGTLHLVPTSDVRWLLALLAPKVVAGSKRRMAELAIDEASLGRCRAQVERVLADQRLDRETVFAAFEAIGESTAGQRGYHLVWQLAQRGVICMTGACRAPRFVLVDAYVPPSRAVPRDEALAALAARYVAGHGPVTEADLAWWAGLGLRDARIGLEGAGALLTRTTVAGATYWSSDDGDPPEPGVHLLPGFDELILGYRDRSASLDPAHADRVCPGGNGVFRPVVAVDGAIVATWRVRATKRLARITVEPFRSAIDPDRLAVAAERYGRYLGLPIEG